MKKLIVGYGSVLALLVMLFSPQNVVRAATITVDLSCTLIDAIESANTNTAVGGCVSGSPGQDTIVLSQDVVLTTIQNGVGPGANGLPIISEDLIITTDTPGTTRIIQRSQSAPEFRILEVGGGTAPSVELREVSIMFGHITGAPAVAGGCINVNAGHLTIVDSVLANCRAEGADSSTSNGSDAQGGAVYAVNGSLTLVNASVYLNSAEGGDSTASGFIGGKADGGAIGGNTIHLEIVDSFIDSNSAVGGDGESSAGYGQGGGIKLSNSDGLITGTLMLSNIALGGTSTNGSSAVSLGGGVSLNNSTVTFEEVDLQGNVALGQDSVNGLGGYARGGALYAVSSTVTLLNSDVNQNMVTAGNPSGQAYGGGLYLLATTTSIEATTIEANAVSGFIAMGGGLYQESGTTTAITSTFFNNTALLGGGITIDGQTSASSTLELVNVTVSGNTANANGGGLYVVGAANAPDQTSVSLYHATVTDNINDGIYLLEDLSAPELLVANSIVGEQASGIDCNTNGTVIMNSKGGNLESGTSCLFTRATDQQSVVDLGLDVLADNGGDTLTHALLTDSPAVDAGRRLACNNKADGRDQRGLYRFYDGDGDGSFACDSGSAEYQGLLSNPGFEDILNPSADWSVHISGGGDGRQILPTALNGEYAFIFEANNAMEWIRQSVAVMGDAGDVYTISFQVAGQGLTIGDLMNIMIRTMNGGVLVDTQPCVYNLSSSNFTWQPVSCVLTATNIHDMVNVTIGWDHASSGSLVIDTIALIH